MLYVSIDMLKIDNHIKEKIKQSNGNFKLIKPIKKVTCDDEVITLYKLIEYDKLKFKFVTYTNI